MVDQFQSSSRQYDNDRSRQSDNSRNRSFDSSLDRSNKHQDRQLDTDREGDLTLQLEQTTAKLPSATWLGLAVGSMVASAGIAVFSKRKDFANFVGLWAPSFLLIGIYNKLVKIEQGASDEMSGKKAA